MRRQAIITAVDEKHIEAVALLSDVCVHCPRRCGERGKPFLVENRYKFPVEVGDFVRVHHSRLVRGVSGITALLGPVACAFFCYAFAPQIAEKLHVALTEPLRALFIFAGIVVPSVLIFIVNRSNLHIFKPVITQIL